MRFRFAGPLIPPLAKLRRTHMPIVSAVGNALLWLSASEGLEALAKLLAQLFSHLG